MNTPETPRTNAEEGNCSDSRFNVTADFARTLERENAQWKAMAQELAAKLEAAAHTFRMRFASNVDTLKTTPTPYDETLSRFNELNK